MNCLECQFTRALEAENAIKTNIIILREHEIRQLNAQVTLMQDYVNWLKAALEVNKTVAETSLQNESACV